MVVQAILTVPAAVCTAQVASRLPASNGAASGVRKTRTSPESIGRFLGKSRLFVQNL